MHSPSFIPFRQVLKAFAQPKVSGHLLIFPWMGRGIADDAECSGWFYTFQERADGGSRWDLFIIPNIPIEQSLKHLGEGKGHHCWNEFKCIITCFPYPIMYIMIVSNSPEQQAIQMLSPAFAILYVSTLNQYILIGKHHIQQQPKIIHLVHP